MDKKRAVQQIYCTARSILLCACDCYGYSFEYNINTSQQRHKIEGNITKWAEIARESQSRTYFAPLQTNDINGKSILPMIRVLLDGYDYRETGLCYAEIDFNPIVEILSSSQETQNMLLIYNADIDLTRSINCDTCSAPFGDKKALTTLSLLSADLSGENPVLQDTLKTTRGQFAVNGCINTTTGWRLIQVISNEKVTHAYRDTLASYFGIFLSCILLGLLLAIFLSRILTKPVSTLCTEIDLLDASKGGQVDIASCGSNRELQQVQRYMTIQNIRFPGKFCCDINIPPEFLSMKLPVFLFQPLVENSVEHGFSSRETDCYISISCQIEGDQLHFLVADNGSGISSEKLTQLKKAWAAPCAHESQNVADTAAKSGAPSPNPTLCSADKKTASSHPSPQQETGRKRHRSIGILNVNQRLRSYYGAPYGLSVESMEGEGTIIDIILPAAALTVEPQLFRSAPQRES